MTKDISHLVKIQDEIKKAEKEKLELAKLLANASKEIVRLQAKLVQECTHPTTKVTTEYVSGDYYNRSVTYYWDECTICKTRFNERTRQGSYD